MKSTVRRYHLKLCEKGVYQAIFLDLLRPRYEIKNRSLPLYYGYEGYLGEKKGSTGHEAIKSKLEQIECSDQSKRPSPCLSTSPANVHDSRLYEQTFEAFEIPEMQEHPAIISIDAAMTPKKFASTIGNEE